MSNKITTEEAIKGLNSAIEFLQKGMPKKPIQKDTLHAFCPICGEVAKIFWAFCPKCGQRLDWGDEE